MHYNAIRYLCAFLVTVYDLEEKNIILRQGA